ncbi:MAG: phosphatidylserine decarboxylase family protein [Bacteroidales bacterium]|nr:phosphatidylserine decarboxylase family protein [Bacteroidales bacterium]
MKIHKAGLPIIASVVLICAVAIYLCLRFIPYAGLAWPLAGVFAFYMVFIFFFFRIPSRETPKGENVLTSVADGKVVIIGKVFEGEYLKKECMQVSVYMNFFNVHVNFWPTSGNVTYYKYHPGRYFLAFLPKASELNEHTSICVDNGCGEVFFKQLAGTFARRIVCYAKEGEQGVQGTQCGIIKFGSRIDMFLPLDCDIKVSLGEKVRACETIIATMPKADK